MDLRKLCRICFVDDTLVDITQHTANIRSLNDGGETEEETTILEIMKLMFANSKHIQLDLTNELPMMCTSCLEECLLHYSYYSRLVISNRQLRQFYDEAQKEIVEPEKEFLIETDVMADVIEEVEAVVEAATEEEVEEPIVIEEFIALKPSKKLANEDTLIVSEFLLAKQTNFRTDAADLNCHSGLLSSGAASYELMTVDYAAVELKHNNLDEYNEANRLLDSEPNGSQAVFKCIYCPLAYTSQQYLKAHVLKCHVCKYCTSSFPNFKDLNDHIRTKHANHRCVVCSNTFSTNSNLRAHLKRQHGVVLPAQVALLNYRPAVTQQQSNNYCAEND